VLRSVAGWLPVGSVPPGLIGPGPVVGPGARAVRAGMGVTGLVLFLQPTPPTTTATSIATALRQSVRFMFEQ
jgi:hypothetical protein